MVFRWKDRASAPPGAIVTEHLALSPAGQGPLTSLERKTGSIETLWNLLHPESGSLDVAVRAVVIDAFTLPDATIEETTLRSDLVAFVQALEGEGISTVIVEEATEQRASWLPFIVDLVFEIAWVADPDSADLHRKLRCSKCRYAHALAGPHDYGLDMGFPGVWPDLLAVASAPAGRDLDVQRPAAVILLFQSLTSGASSYVRFGRGGVALLERNRQTSQFLSLISLTPGIVIADVRCGPLNVIGFATLPHAIQVPDSEGAHSLGWALVRATKERRINVVVLHDPEALLRRQRFAIPLLHVVEALRRLGVLVLIHAKQEHLEALTSIADVSTNGSSGYARELRTFPRSRMRWSYAWITDAPGTDEGSLGSVEGHQGRTSSYSQLRSAQKQVLAQDILGARNTLIQMRPEHGGALIGRIWIASAWLLHRLGMVNAAVERMSMGSRYSSGALSDESIWARALVAPNESIFSELSEMVSARPVSDSLVLLWTSMCAVYAQSEAAIESLEQRVGGPQECLFIGFLLRALALRGHGLDVTRTAERFGLQHQLPDWLVRRMKEEAMLEAPRDFERVEAFERLVTLQSSEDVPLLHRADIAHNLGTFREDMGQSAEAVRWYQAALALNPLLEFAREGLARLGAPVPPQV